MSTIEDTIEEFEVLSARQRLAKLPAVRQLADRLERRGYSEVVSRAIANAIVDPADARGRLEHLTTLRVPGGRVRALDCLLWAPALVPFPSNLREASMRHYPAGGDDDTRYPPVRQPRATNGSAELEIEVQSREHLVWSLDRSFAYLQDVNPWNESIAEQGVMVPIIAAVAMVEHADGAPPVTVITTPDGSSRTASALHILGLTPLDIVYDLPQNQRRLRSFISDAESVLDRPVAEADERELARLRALQIPARLLLDFEPDRDHDVDFATAVDSLVHLVHVEAPRPWDEAAQYDAKAEAVLDALVEARLVPGQQRDYLSGMLTPAEASGHGFPAEEDERAATIIRVVKRDRFHEAIRRGIRLLDPKKYAQKFEKVKIGVELALRARRGQLSIADARIARTTLRSTYLQSEIWDGSWTVSRREPSALRRAALAELKAGAAGKAIRELAVLGVYWLGTHLILREAHFFFEKSQRDGRNPQKILSLMLTRRWGIEVLHRAIVDGRAGIKPRRVDPDGKLVRNPTGGYIDMDDGWLRGQVVPEGAPIEEMKSTPLARLRTRMASFSAEVDILRDSHDEIRQVLDKNGDVLIDVEGWKDSDAEELRSGLDELSRQLLIYGHVWSMRHRDRGKRPEEAQGEDDD